MQAIKTVAFRKAESTSRRIREQTAWFFLRHMHIDEDTSPPTTFRAPDTEKMIAPPARQGEKKIWRKNCFYPFCLVWYTSL